MDGSPGGAAGAPIQDASHGDAPADATSDLAPDAGRDVVPCDPDAADIVGRLRCLPGVEIVSAQPRGELWPDYQRIDLTIDQPVDHDQPAGAHFRQRLSLVHRDEAAPLVLETTGYTMTRGRGSLAPIFGANVLNVEHRYYGGSYPNPTDWRYLDIRQTAADFHDVARTFKSIFKGRWIGTGASKGGMTSVYHRRFYPDDVDATVAFVSPLTNSRTDARAPAFLAQVGGDKYAECRDKLREVQTTILERRNEIEPLMTEPFSMVGGKEVALERTVVLLPFTFWQYWLPDGRLWGCATIPARDAPIETLYTFVQDVGLVPYDVDPVLKTLLSYYYQVEQQLGAPMHDRSHLASLLRYEEQHRNPRYFLTGNPPLPEWDDGEAMADVQRWVLSDGAKRLLFIDGEFDPWSATPFAINPTGDNHRFVIAGRNHNVDYGQLGEASAAVLAILERWMGVPPKMSAVGDALPAERRMRRPL
jgi:hypothetical protein